jgi:hypothetical protein
VPDSGATSSTTISTTLVAPTSEAVPIHALIARPPALELYDVDAVRALLEDAPVLRATIPEEPYIAAPARPQSGGEALELADLALMRGDALDAAAQYRALLPRLDPHAATYAKLRLARAYTHLRDRPRAKDLLYGIAGSLGPFTWQALVDLADLSVTDIGAAATLRELTPMAGARSELLADHLIHTAPDHVAAELLVDKASRLERCDYAQAALKLDASVSLGALSAACHKSLEESRRAIAMQDFGTRYLPYFERRNLFVARWDALALAARSGDLDPHPWVRFAEDLVAIRPLALNAERSEETDTIVRAALVAAIELSPDELRDDDWLVSRIRRVAGALGARHRDLVLGRLAARMPVPPP